jgi:nitrogen regulatory protein PII
MKKIEIILPQNKILCCLNILKRYAIIDEYVLSDIKEKSNKKIVIEYRGQIYETEVLEEFTKIEAIVDEEKLNDAIQDLLEVLKSENGCEKIIVCDVLETIPRVQKKKIKKTNTVELNAIESGTLSRDELLKQLGIKEPDEDFIENLIKETFDYSEDTLLTEDEIKDIELSIENELDKNVLSILKDQDLIEDYALKIKIGRHNNRYVCKCDINNNTEKIFGDN